MQAIDLFNDLDFDPGKLLDHRYQIVACLGHGGMGRVYKAFHVMLDAPVALKELLTPAHATDEERQRAIRRFRREAHLLTALRHPSIPRVLDYFTDGQSFYLVMDYIAGQTLAQRLQTDEDRRCEPLPLDEALDYACQLCNVLIYLHSQEPAVVFGDLKPSNVILTPDGRAVMVDFGIARPSTGHNEPLPHIPGGRSSSFADLIGDNQPLGTAGYAAPEQYEPGWHADPRSDIFALGVLLHQMVTGHAPPPFPFGFHPARELNPSVPPALEELIERALRFRADERFQSGWEMYRALRLVAQEVAFQQFQTEEITTSPGDEAPQVIIQPVTRRSHTQVLHLRRALLTSAGAAGAMMALTLALLFFSLGSNAHIAQNMLSHPFAAAPAPADTPTPTPTPIPTQPPRVSPTPTLPPPPIMAPGTVPTPTPRPAPTNTPIPTPPPTATPSPTPTDTPTPTPTPTETPTPEPSPTPTPPAP